MQVIRNTHPPRQRVNASELRYLRTQAEQLHQPGTCFWQTVRTIVVSAAVAFGWDLSQEERALQAEKQQRAHMTVSA